MAVLFVSVVMLFVITIAAFYTNKGAVMEQRISTNQLAYTQAFEAAQGSLNYALAWLATAANTNSTAWTTAPGAAGAVWVSDTSYPPYNQRNSTSIAAQTIGAFSVSITLWRNSANSKIIEISSVSSGDATATVKQIVNVLYLAFNVPSLAPLVVNGCISAVTGTPDIDAGSVAATALISSQPAACLNTGHFNITGTVAGSGFSGNAWDYTFGISKTEMYQLASSQAGGATAGPIYFYDDSNPPTDPWHTSLGDSANPVILIFNTASCPKISGGGGVDIYGIVYCYQGLDMQGWGNATIHGSVITDTDITKFTANTLLTNDSNANSTSSYSANPVVSKITGTWRDF